MTKGVSIVIPCKDEAARILDTVDEVQRWCRANLDAFEIVVVDDGSTDGTADAVRRRFGDGVRVLALPENRGKGHAIRRGVELATLPRVLFLDADHAIHVRHLETFLPAAVRAPVVVGSKRHPGAEVERSGLRAAAGHMGQWLIGRLACPGIHDTQCGFKLLDTDLARSLLAFQRIERFGYDFELLFLARRAGAEIVELPVHCRDAGDGSVRPGSYLHTLGELLRFSAHRVRGRYRAVRPAPCDGRSERLSSAPPSLPEP